MNWLIHTRLIALETGTVFINHKFWKSILIFNNVIESDELSTFWWRVIIINIAMYTNIFYWLQFWVLRVSTLIVMFNTIWDTFPFPREIILFRFHLCDKRVLSGFKTLGLLLFSCRCSRCYCCKARIILFYTFCHCSRLYLFHFHSSFSNPPMNRIRDVEHWWPQQY